MEGVTESNEFNQDFNIWEIDFRNVTENPGHVKNWTWSDYIRAVIFCTIILCTIIGNALVLIAVLTRRNLRSPTHIFIANLAIADFLVGFFVLPFLATYQLTNTWYFGQGYCTAWVCIHFWLCSSSILSVCAICLERYIGVEYPLQHYLYMGRERVGIVIIAVWLIACCLSTIPVFVWPEPLSADPLICKINQQLGHVLVASVGILYIPTLIMIILYWKIYRAARKHLSSIRRGFKPPENARSSEDDSGESGMRIHVGRGSSSDEGYSDSSATGSGVIPNCTSSQENLTVISYKRQTKTAKKLAIVVGAFILSYVPFFTLFLIRSLDIDLISIEVFNIFGWIRYFNSCLNPMIYAAMLPAFRTAFKEIILCRR